MVDIVGIIVDRYHAGATDFFFAVLIIEEMPGKVEQIVVSLSIFFFAVVRCVFIVFGVCGEKPVSYIDEVLSSYLWLGVSTRTSACS